MMLLFNSGSVRRKSVACDLGLLYRIVAGKFRTCLPQRVLCSLGWLSVKAGLAGASPVSNTDFLSCRIATGSRAKMMQRRLGRPL